MSIAGMSGLYKLVAQTKAGFIVESLTDKKRHPINASQKISMLEDISVFTRGGDMPLKEVMLKMKEQDEKVSKVDPKGSPDELKKLFKSVLPDFDEERVYASDIKKMITWYQFVRDLVDKEEEPAADADQPDSPAAISGREHHAHAGVADHQKIKTPDKKVTSVKTRKKV